MGDLPLTETEMLEVLGCYLGLLQTHPSAEEMMAEVLTEDFETGFVGGFIWSGLDGLRDFLHQRDGFFDESHQVKEVLGSPVLDGDEIHLKTRLEFFLRRWKAPSPTSEEFTGSALHTWHLRQVHPQWRVAAQLVNGFDDLNENAKRLFATPDEGLNE
jgi:hypothetical protein